MCTYKNAELHHPGISEMTRSRITQGLNEMVCNDPSAGMTYRSPKEMHQSPTSALKVELILAEIADLVDSGYRWFDPGRVDELELFKSKVKEIIDGH